MGTVREPAIRDSRPRGAALTFWGTPAPVVTLTTGGGGCRHPPNYPRHTYGSERALTRAYGSRCKRVSCVDGPMPPCHWSTRSAEQGRADQDRLEAHDYDERASVVVDRRLYGVEQTRAPLTVISYWSSG